jgi:hypothetical protein
MHSLEQLVDFVFAESQLVGPDHDGFAGRVRYR